MKLSKAKAALDKTLKVSSKDAKLSVSDLSLSLSNARKGQTVLCGIAASDEGNKALTTELTADHRRGQSPGLYHMQKVC